MRRKPRLLKARKKSPQINRTPVKGSSIHKFAVTTSVRSGKRAVFADGTRGEETDGSLLIIKVNLKSNSVDLIKSIELPGSPHTAGRSSQRGVCQYGKYIAVCNATQLMIVDPFTAKIIAIKDHKFFGDIHSIFSKNGIIYVTATCASMIIGFNNKLKEVYRWYAGDSEALSSLIPETHKRKVEKEVDFRNGAHKDQALHINHIFDYNGDIALSLGSKHIYYNLTKDKVLFKVPGAISGKNGAPTHDGIYKNGHFYCSRTSTGHFLKLNEDGTLIKKVPVRHPHDTTTGSNVVKTHGWLRGAAWIRNELFIAGQQGQTFFLVNMRNGKVKKLRASQRLASTVVEGTAIYGIEKLTRTKVK